MCSGAQSYPILGGTPRAAIELCNIPSVDEGIPRNLGLKQLATMGATAPRAEIREPICHELPGRARMEDRVAPMDFGERSRPRAEWTLGASARRRANPPDS